MTQSNIPTWIEGVTSRQAHADLPQGSFERELGREGFYGPVSHMYHRHAPTGWSSFEGPLRPRAFDGTRIGPMSSSPMEAPALFGNAAVRFRYWRGETSMDHLVRNSDGDELLFVHEGDAEWFCDYGHLHLAAGDYVRVPRGTLWRLAMENPVTLLLIEATNASLGLPDRGLLGPTALYDPAILDHPRIDSAFESQRSEEPWTVVVKKRQALSRIHYPFNPLDALGWHGTNAPIRLNWRDIRPVMSHRYHVPPSAHTTFVSDRFVVCTFVPRPFETDPQAIKVPFFHSNEDYDEIIFYHAGEFFSRDNIHPGMMTLHPSGVTHGPHPKALRNIFQQKAAGTNEVAVNVDTRDPLEVLASAESIEWKEYANSWKSS
ncbi:MAG: homogentisate 1,2-dioxygenase [Gammaproteobacteria bacterium]